MSEYNLSEIQMFHSDRGGEFKNRLLEEMMEGFSWNRSLSRKGCPFDNAVIESLNYIIRPNLFEAESLKVWNSKEWCFSNVHTGIIITDYTVHYLITHLWNFEKGSYNKWSCLVLPDHPGNIYLPVQQRNDTEMGFLVFVLYILFVTRIYAGIAVTLGLFIDYLLNEKTRTKKVALIIGALIVIPTIGLMAAQSYITLLRSYASNITLSTEIALQLLTSVISMFLSPFFWNMNETVNVYTPLVLDSTFFLLSSPAFIFLFLKIAINTRLRNQLMIYVVPVLIHIITLGLEYGVGGNRQRMGIYPFIVLFYVYGFIEIYRSLQRKDQRIPSSALK